MPADRRALWPFRIASILLGCIASLLLGELAVRALIDDRRLSPVSNVYRPSTVPGLGYTFRPDYRGLAFGVELETDSLGFRQPAHRPRSPVVERLVCVGDSHTFGFGVSASQSFCQVLARQLEDHLGVGVVAHNLAVNGYNIDQLAAVVRSIAPAYEPTLYVIVVANNDDKPALSVGPEGWLHWTPEPQANSRLEDGSRENLVRGLEESFFRRSYLARFVLIEHRRLRLQRSAQRIRMETGAEPDSSWMTSPASATEPLSPRLRDKVYPQLTDLLDDTLRQGVPAVLATVCASRDYRSMFERMRREGDRPVLELLTLFPEAESWQDLLAKFGLGWDPHLNAVAHARWADALSELIIEHELVDSLRPASSSR